MIALITGSRNWNDLPTMEGELELFRQDISVLVHGKAPGADTMAGNIAKRWGIPVVEIPALWDAEGKPAGTLRNIRMLSYAQAIAKAAGESVMLFAFPLPESKGTLHMINIATLAGLEIVRVDQ